MNTLFQEIFGSKQKIKVIEFFLDADIIDFGATDVAEKIKVCNQTTYVIIKSFVKLNILQETRVLKGKQFYALNKISKTTKILKKVFTYLSK
jgi:hypothetical protein